MDPKSVHVRRGDIQIVDVREDSEWVAGRIEGASHIPLGQLAGRLGELDRNRPVVAVCRSGRRSSKARKLLNKAGLTAHNMDGGVAAWVAAGLPIHKPDGRPGHA